MRAHVSCAAVVLILSSLLFASSDPAEQLKTRADKAHGGDQAKLCLEYARVELETSNALFTDGQVDKGQAAIGEVVDYSRKGADAAAASGKQLKETEIKLRKLGERMHDIGQSLAFEDRPLVKEALDKLEHIRADLIVKMWGQQAEPKGKS
jgi:hypothetical protein